MKNNKCVFIENKNIMQIYLYSFSIKTIIEYINTWYLFRYLIIIELKIFHIYKDNKLI